MRATFNKNNKGIDSKETAELFASAATTLSALKQSIASLFDMQTANTALKRFNKELMEIVTSLETPREGFVNGNQ